VICSILLYFLACSSKFTDYLPLGTSLGIIYMAVRCTIVKYKMHMVIELLKLSITVFILPTLSRLKMKSQMITIVTFSICYLGYGQICPCNIIFFFWFQERVFLTRFIGRSFYFFMSPLYLF
jgi:hypothetical protein